MATEHSLFQLHVDGRPFRPKFECIKRAAADAMEMGFARPDEQGRIVLEGAATIKRVAHWRCSRDNQFSLDTSCPDLQSCAQAGHCLANGSRNIN